MKLKVEAGALSKTFGDGSVCPPLLGMRVTDLDGPSSQFQTTVREEMLALAAGLNAELGNDQNDEQVCCRTR